MNNIKVIQELIENVNELKYRDNANLDAIRRKTNMVVRNILGETSKYLYDLKLIHFHPMIAPASDEFKLESWNDGKNSLINVLNTIKEELEMFGVKKPSLKEIDKKGNKTVNNFTGANSRINLNSIDNSSNVINQNTNDKLFDEIRNLIKENVKENTSEILEAITLMEQNQGKPSFKESFDNFISKAANYITLLTPLIPQLTSLIGK